MQHEEYQYLNLLDRLLREGEERTDRTGVGTQGLFGVKMRFSLRDHFPLLTTKKIHFDSVVHELLWFLRGDTNIRYLQENGVKIWDEWADEHGDLGPIYGKQWRRCSSSKGTGHEIDQIAKLEKNLRNDPFSRRHILSSWNTGEIDDMALPPCHILAQFYVSRAKELSCQFYQRSADVFLGLPFNIASYALLCCMMAKATGMKPSELVFMGGDVHLYKNHLEQAKEQLQRRTPHPFPLLMLGSVESIDSFRYEHIQIENYKYHPHIKAEVAI